MPLEMVVAGVFVFDASQIVVENKLIDNINQQKEENVHSFNNMFNSVVFLSLTSVQVLRAG